MAQTNINQEAQMLRFTVIITVYNTKTEYLCECVKSVLRQTYDNIEIIIVDDGSDNADTLLYFDELKSAAKSGDKSLTVIHKPNGGQGSARNVGIRSAHGDYLIFLDNDDYYLSDNFLAEMDTLLEESHADICSFQYVEFFDDGKRPSFQVGVLTRDKVYKKSTDAALKALLSAPRRVFSAATHTKAIRTGLFREHNIVSPEGLSNEDVYLSAKLVRHAVTYDRYDFAVYAYRRANAASLSTKRDSSFSVGHNVLTHIRTLLEDKELANDKNVLDFLSSPYVYWLGKMVSARINADNTNRALIETDIKTGKRYAYLLRHSSRPYVRCLGIIIRIFGLEVAMCLLRVYLTLNNKHMLSVKRKIG
ncbi:sugar transferase [Synergistales bacterium]|nr:sugar transferase [Synergistales bacterium]